ncbi:MAG: ComF family protein [Acidimicrobiales bacterium]
MNVIGWFLGGACMVCGASGSELCRPCRWQLPRADQLDAPPPLASLAALLRYEQRGRDLVVALKYHNRRALLGELGMALAQMVPAGANSVSWVPTTARRRHRRGYDQAELLARAVARAAGIRCRPLLRRLDRHPQTGRRRSERLIGPELAVIGPVGGVVVLVDDVVTTGSTLRAGGSTLVAAGATEVHGLALAQTPEALRTPSGTPHR